MSGKPRATLIALKTMISARFGDPEKLIRTASMAVVATLKQAPNAIKQEPIKDRIAGIISDPVKICDGIRVAEND